MLYYQENIRHKLLFQIPHPAFNAVDSKDIASVYITYNIIDATRMTNILEDKTVYTRLNRLCAELSSTLHGPGHETFYT